MASSGRATVPPAGPAPIGLQSIQTRRSSSRLSATGPNRNALSRLESSFGSPPSADQKLTARRGRLALGPCRGAAARCPPSPKSDLRQVLRKSRDSRRRRPAAADRPVPSSCKLRSSRSIRPAPLPCCRYMPEPISGRPNKSTRCRTLAAIEGSRVNRGDHATQECIARDAISRPLALDAGPAIERQRQRRLGRTTERASSTARIRAPAKMGKLALHFRVLPDLPKNRIVGRRPTYIAAL